MVRSGYVLAGFETFANYVDKFIRNIKGRYEDNFTREDIDNFTKTSCSGFLHSYGQGFGGKRNYKKYAKDKADLFKKCRGFGFFNDSHFITDSGGFQIATGQLDRNEAALLLKLYYEFLEEYYEVVDRAFILDIPPGEKCIAIQDFDDLYKWNFDSYIKAASLPDHVRTKIIYVHHFRSPRLWETFDKILKENDLYSYFDHFGTGGIVASMSGDVAIRYAIYVLPLVPMLNETIKHKRSHLDFHILGGANFRDILFYELFRIHVKKVHKIDLNITYDSAGMYKGLMKGRFIQILHDGQIHKVDLRTTNLKMRFGKTDTAEDTYKSALRDMALRNNFKPITTEEIYGPVTFWEEYRVYSMLYSIDIYSVMQTRMRELAEKIYNLYGNGEIEEFNNHIELATRNLNQGKITRKQTAKFESIAFSLDLLTNLDEEHCQYIVKKYLSKDEFTNLISSEQILTI